MEDIQTTREILRKFALKAIDSEAEIYTQIPPAWRTKSKVLFKSMVNLFAGFLDENLVYDCIQAGIDANYYHKISEEEMFKRIAKSLTRQLNIWAAQRKFYVKKASFANANKILTSFQQQISDFPDWSRENQEVEQLKEEIEQLRQEIQKLRNHSEQNPEQQKNEMTTKLENKIAAKEAEIKKINALNQTKNQETSILPKNFLGGPLVEQQLTDLAQRMEKIDQNQANKWSGGTVALIAIGCLLGGGLLAFLLYFVFRKKKN